MRRLIGWAFLLASCAAPGVKPVMIALPSQSEIELSYTCDTADYTPAPPKTLRVPKTIADYSIALEISREKLIQARDDCNAKLIKLLQGKI